MTWFSVKLSLRRFFYLLIALAILVTGAVIWLSQFDLNQYRDTLEQQLSQVLEQPVQIGAVSLTFSSGLALEVEQLRIGDQEMPQVTVPIMLANLDLGPLLDRRIVFHDIRLQQPEINVVLPSSDNSEEQSSTTKSFQLPEALSINRLHISDAEINIYRTTNKQLNRQVHLTNLQATVDHLQHQTVADLVITGQLKERNASFLLETTLPPRLDPQYWRNNDFRTLLTVRHLETKGLLQLKNRRFPDQVDFQVGIEGAPIRGARVTTTLIGSKSAEELITLKGTWNSDAQEEQLSELSGNLLGVPLAGQITLSHNTESNHLKGQLGISDLELTPALLQRWRIPHAEELISGQLKQLRLSLDQHWPATEKLTKAPRLDASIDLTQLQWLRPELQYLEDFAADLVLHDHQLQIQKGLFHLNDNSFTFGGTIDYPFQSPKLAVTIATKIPITTLASKIQIPEEVKLRGTLPVQMAITGTPPFPDFSLTANLTPLDISYADYFIKKQGVDSRLLLSGTFDDSEVQVNQSKLTLNGQSIAASGVFQRSSPTRDYSLKVEAIDLKQLSFYSPRLKNLQSEGTLGGTIAIKPASWQSQLRLDGVGAHLTSILGDLRNTTGTIELNSSGLTFSQLKAGLGQSNFIVSGTLANWAAPTLSLDVSGTDIRAHDLIFLNQELTFYDLEGHLIITGKGISFSPVNVRLEEGTVAHVTGSVTNFSDPEVKLDISGEKVDVLDVINLFIGPDKNPKTSQNQTKKEHKPIIISVHADQGVIRGFNFQNAHGLITDTHDHFVLAPLTFENGAGKGNARVVFDRADKRAPLKISGHVDKIDASILHQDMFDKPGLISGHLDGDFYLEGDPVNNEFWPTVQGGMHVKVKEGVLRKFNTLSKVFSILNVAQLFKGQLPDMDREGMPFSLLEGSVRLAEGRVTTEDLKVHSDAMNMSMVGWQGIIEDEMDFTLGIMPLGTVDKVITSIPIAGWVLTGENKAFLTAYFKLTGTSKNPSVSAIPVDSLSDTVLGTFKRTLGLPGKLLKDIRGLFQKEAPKKAAP